MMTEDGMLIASEAGIEVRSFEDIPDVIGACFGASSLLLTEEELSPDFFNLKSGLAGELLQKFTNYRIRVAIVVPDPGTYGERFAELAREHRTHRLIRFVPSVDDAVAWLAM
jgi:hypothetical protein